MKWAYLWKAAGAESTLRGAESFMRAEGPSLLRAESAGAESEGGESAGGGSAGAGQSLPADTVPVPIVDASTPAATSASQAASTPASWDRSAASLLSGNSMSSEDSGYQPRVVMSYRASLKVHGRAARMSAATAAFNPAARQSCRVAA